MQKDMRTTKPNLLTICHAYGGFYKDQIDGLSSNFSSVCVLVRIHALADMADAFSIPLFPKNSSSSRISKNRIPENVRVFPTTLWYLPTDGGYKKLGEKHLARVERQIRKQGIAFDLIHSHFTWSFGYVGARLKERYDVPFIVTAHGYDIYSLPFKDAEWREKIEYVLNTADAIITVSQRNLECIKKLNVDTAVHVIPNGFRGDLFAPRDMVKARTMLGLPQDRRILLTVGELKSVKGHRYLIEAVGQIVKKRRDILCIIVGAGGEKRALQHQISALGLEKYILLAGSKPHDGIPLWMNACDLFVLPSLNEGNPIVMFEALGCGKPIIGTKVGGIPEIITSEEYGLLVDSADPTSLAEKILLGLEKEWIQEKIVAYASEYDIKNIIKCINIVFQEVGEKAGLSMHT